MIDKSDGVLKQVKFVDKKMMRGPKTGQNGQQKIMGVLRRVKFVDKKMMRFLKQVKMVNRK